MARYKKIKGFEAYEVSDDGVVRSVERVVKRKDGVLRKYPSKQLSRQIVDGYYVVDLFKNNKVYRKYVHTLVGYAFCPVPKIKKGELMVVNHKDGDKLNAHYTNLEITTQKANIKHAWDTGLIKRKRKK